MDESKNQIRKEFEMSDLGPLTCYVGIEVEQMQDCIEDCIVLNQAGSEKPLDKAQIVDCNPMRILMEPELNMYEAKNSTKMS